MKRRNQAGTVAVLVFLSVFFIRARSEAQIEVTGVGPWRGRLQDLERQRFDERDLALTTDFRHVCGEALDRHLGRKDRGKTFPVYRFFAPPPDSIG